MGYNSAARKIQQAAIGLVNPARRRFRYGNIDAGDSGNRVVPRNNMCERLPVGVPAVASKKNRRDQPGGS